MFNYIFQTQIIKEINNKTTIDMVDYLEKIITG